MFSRTSQSQEKLDKRAHERYINIVLNRLRLLVNKENDRGGHVAPIMRKRFMTTPREIYEKSFVRISIASLYRRYRGIYINGLTEALAIAQQCNSKEEMISKLRHKIIDAGTVEKEYRKQIGAS